MWKKCLIQKYDPSVRTPPYKFINLGEVDVEFPEENNDGGSEKWLRMKHACARLGYVAKSWSILHDSKYECVILVNGTLEEMRALGMSWF